MALGGLPADPWPGAVVADQLTVAALPPAAGLVPIPVVASLAQARERGYAMVLDYFPEGLGLLRVEQRERPLAVEFVAGRQGWRGAQDRFRHELVVKSCLTGLAAEGVPSVVDATAGLGRDAFLLACAGARVTLVERQPVMAALLRDGLQRLTRAMPELAERMTLLEGEAAQHLADLSGWPDCVLLDPMFPLRQKSAAVKKELVILQQLESPPTADQEETLLAAARAATNERVVVKRPLRAPVLAGETPAYQRAGKTVRFDVYLR